MKFKKATIWLLMILLLIPMLIPMEALAAYPSGARTNLDTGGIKNVTSGLQWNNHSQYPTLKYSLENPAFPDFFDDYMYESNWFVSVNGKDTGKKMMLMRPRSATAAGRTLAQPADVAWWGKQFNGNPDFVKKTSAAEPTTVKNTLDQTQYQRAYSRDLAEWSGAISGTQGTGDRDDGPNGNMLEMGRVVITTTPFPKPEIVGPTTAQAGKSIKFDLKGQEFYPHQEYNSRPEIKYEFKMNGKELKTKKEFKSTFTDSHTLDTGICKAGTYTFELTATDRVERSTTVKHTITITGTAEGCGDVPPPGGGGGSCSIAIIEKGNGQTIAQNVMNPSPNGSISSDNGVFDVVQGIPSSEYLQVQAQSERYLVNQSFVQKKGDVVVTVPVSKDFTLEWEDVETETDEEGNVTEMRIPQSETETIETTVEVVRPWTYWEIGKYSVHNLESSTFTNYALPGGTTTVPANTGLTASGDKTDGVDNHVFPPDCSDIVLPSETINGGTSKPSAPSIDGEAKSAADGEVGEAEVKNDKAEFDGGTIMDDTQTPVNGPTPNQVPSPPNVDMTRGSLHIDDDKTNYWHSSSTGEVLYTELVNINGDGGDKVFPFPVNDVTVHTPVVIYAKSTDDKEHDQRTNPPNRSTPPNPDVDRHALILDRPFTVTLPTTGMHRPIPGYGNNDFAKYTKSKQVRFPFDVYTSDKTVFHPANTWIDVPVQQEQVEFFLPVWVPEAAYTMLFRVFAINAPGTNFGTESEANITIPNGAFNIEPAGSQSAAHVATDTIEVDVVGRLYDFRVTDILDFNWGDVFRTTEGLIQHTGNYYWVGGKKIDGDLRGNQAPFTLPVRHGSHPNGYPNERKNMAVKTGYQFKFDMKSKGNMFNGNDAVRITPSFYFVSKNGTDRRPVDIYYHSDSNYFVKIGSEQDKEYRSVTLNEPLRNVEQKQLADTAEYTYRHPNEYGYKSQVDSMSKSSFIRKFERDYSKQKTITGPYSWQILNNKLRTLIGPDSPLVPPSAMVPTIDAKATEQQWYGEYSLPADIYVVEKGRDIAGYGVQHRLNKNSPVFLQDGYVVVNFNIETIDNGDANNPRLQYHKGPLNNQWKMEGFNYNFVDGYGNNFNTIDGDVMFYHGEQSSFDDFKSSVSH